jgi:hypothetical protein
LPRASATKIEQGRVHLTAEQLAINRAIEQSRSRRRGGGVHDAESAAGVPVIAPLTITDNDPMPVELLRDGRGVYGIGVSEPFD